MAETKKVFAFNITVENKQDWEDLAANKFSLGVSKTIKGSDTLVQWLSFPLLSNPAQRSIKVFWTDEYELFFAPSVQNNEIKVGTSTPASVGKAYAYLANSWVPFATPYITSQEIGVRNSQNSVRSFGLAQQNQINDGAKGTPSPVSLSTLLEFGQSSFTPSAEQVTVYFTWMGGNGVVYNPLSTSSQYPFTALDKKIINLNFNNGVWERNADTDFPLEGEESGDRVGTFFRLNPSLLPLPPWHKIFSFKLAVPVLTSALAQWVEETLGNVSVKAQPTFTDHNVLLISSEGDRTKQVLALQGQSYLTPSTISVEEDGSERTTPGIKVHILHVHEAYPEIKRVVNRGEGGPSSSLSQH